MIDVHDLSKTNREAALFLRREVDKAEYEERRQRLPSGWLWPSRGVASMIKARILTYSGTLSQRPTAVY